MLAMRNTASPRRRVLPRVRSVCTASEHADERVDDITWFTGVRSRIASDGDGRGQNRTMADRHCLAVGARVARPFLRHCDAFHDGRYEDEKEAQGDVLKKVIPEK